MTLDEKYQKLLACVQKKAWLGMEKDSLKKIVKNKKDINNDFSSRYILLAEIALDMQKILKEIGELQK